ncbi:CD82 antigen-like isoform X1 [Acipenser ruthenus]|uniref:CD82 antigen-like isoform X1 n=1 Tax=Acipenser ruthenus TaxID=7906 RepID=UPI002740F2E3|nr:CD82 antigen-like isoform X1 [Acipenser ruthenus]XP_058874099.1 CD82 antigen-like isoform X1 [Acipenser ruthenus]
MGAKCCLNITKYFLFLFNLLFFTLGGLMLTFGLWIHFDHNSTTTLRLSHIFEIKLISYLLAGGGTLTMMLGFFGCLGAVKEMRCMLGTYFVILIILLGGQITLGVLIYTQKNLVNLKIKDLVLEIIENYQTGNKSIEDLDIVQQKLQCCGWTSYEDWNKNPKMKEDPSLYPCSCYQPDPTSPPPQCNQSNSSLDPVNETEAILDSIATGQYNQSYLTGEPASEPETTTDSISTGQYNQSYLAGEPASEPKTTTNSLSTGQCNQSLVETKEPFQTQSNTTGFCLAPPGGSPPVFSEGCRIILQSWIHENLRFIWGVCVGIAALELFGMILSMYLCSRLGKNYNKLIRYS